MQLKLLSRNESAGNDKLQLQFSEHTDASPAAPMGMGSGVQLSGWFDRTTAEAFVVGGVYELTLTLA